MTLENSDIKQFNSPYIISFVLFIFSLLYLYSELIFNSLMLDVAGTSFSTPKEIEEIQYYGRIISANGFTLLLLGLFSKSGFRLRQASHWGLALFVIILCSIPVLMIFVENLINIFLGKEKTETKFDPEMGWALMIVPGIFLFLRSGGKNRAFIASGIIIMAWPAMFFGQKLLVERYIIAPTTWQDRLAARYILMTRAKMEECKMQLGDLNICRAKFGNAELKSLNAVLGAFLMNANNAVVHDIDKVKNDILLEQVLKQDKDKIDVAYQYYLDKLNNAKNLTYIKYENDKRKFIQQLYLPYIKASNFYNASLKPPDNIDYLLNKFDKEKEKAWNKYITVASNYNASIRTTSAKLKGILTKIRKDAYECSGTQCEKYKRKMLRQFQRKYNKDWNKIVELCGGNPIEFNCKLSKEEIKIEIHKIKDKEFKQKSGYSPNIKTKADFFKIPKNKNILKDKLLEFLKTEVKDINFTKEDLPDEIDKKSLKKLLSKKILDIANINWSLTMSSKFGKVIAPNLSMPEFFKALDIDIPDLNIEEQFPVMERKFFIEKYILDGYRAKVVEFFDKIESEAPNYANQKSLNEKGKNYIRAIYIPPIAIGLSLVIVFITIGKNLLFVIYSIYYFTINNADIPYFLRKVAYISFWLLYIFMSFIFIKNLENQYIQNTTYKIYYKEADKTAPMTTLMLDGIIKLQPIIYKYFHR